MSMGDRVARHYRRLTTQQLRQAHSYMGNGRRLAAARIVMTERQEAYQRGADAANLMMTITGDIGQEAWGRAVATLARAERAGEHDLWETTKGFLDAVREFAADRAT